MGLSRGREAESIDKVTFRGQAGAMPLAQPFQGVERRIIWLRLTLLVACGASMIASLPLWLNARDFPALPITAGFPVLPAPLDRFYFAGMLLLLPLALWFYRR